MNTGSVVPPQNGIDPAQKERERSKLREMLLAGAESPLSSPVDAAYFESLRDRIRRAAERRDRE